MKIRLPVIIFVLFISFFIFLTFSQTLDALPTMQPEEEELTCEEKTARLDNEILDLTLRNDQNSANYQILLIRLELLSMKAGYLGYDITDLDRNITVLKTYITSFDKNSKLITQKLTLAKNSTCSQLLAQQYGKAIAESRKALKDTMSDVTKIDGFFVNEISQNVATLSLMEVKE